MYIVISNYKKMLCTFLLIYVLITLSLDNHISHVYHRQPRHFKDAAMVVFRMCVFS